jgi:SAM-dependent methyltransferase
MRPEEATELIAARFPFKGYMDAGGMRKGAYASIAATVGRYLAPGSRILDFGCGPCDKTAILQLLGFRCAGMDDLQDEWHRLPGNRDKILRFADECGVDIRLVGDGKPPFEQHSFDMIMLHDVLEHLHDSPRELLNDLLELATPEGLLFITVPNAGNIRKRLDVLRGGTNLPPFEGYYWYPGAWRGHVREYVRSDLEKLAEYLGLDVLELHGCDHMLQKLPAALRPLYLLVTRVFPAWKDSWLLVARKRTNWVPRKTLSHDELTRILGMSTSYRHDE